MKFGCQDYIFNPALNIYLIDVSAQDIKINNRE